MQVNEETCISLSSSKVDLYACTANDSANATFRFLDSLLTEPPTHHVPAKMAHSLLPFRRAAAGGLQVSQLNRWLPPLSLAT